MRLFQQLIFLLFIINLSACEDGKKLERLKEEVQLLRQRAANIHKSANLNLIPQLPNAVVYQSTKSNANLMPSANVSSENPILVYPLKSYQFVGTLSEGASTTAFILAPNHMTYPVKEGDMLGNEGGVVNKISSDQIAILIKNTMVKPSKELLYTIQLKD